MQCYYSSEGSSTVAVAGAATAAVAVAAAGAGAVAVEVAGAKAAAAVAVAAVVAGAVAVEVQRLVRTKIPKRRLRQGSSTHPVARRWLGDGVRGPRFTDVEGHLQKAKDERSAEAFDAHKPLPREEFFTKPALSYPEYKQQCEPAPWTLQLLVVRYTRTHVWGRVQAGPGTIYVVESAFST